MLIRDLEHATGLDRATIRFYEREGLITPQRLENGYRVYSDGDRDALMKIKLLRQLGMTLEQIKEIQQGRGELSSALSAQLHILDGRIQSMERAKDVCQQIRDAGIPYDALDAPYYLNILSTPVLNAPKWGAKPTQEFRELLPRPYHPVRRLAARWIDLAILGLLIQFLFFVVLRVRAGGQVLSLAIAYGTPFVLVPVAAVLLRFFGTTPGKWAMGLRVESANGGTLRFSEALEREWEVLRYGMGFGIPVWSLWRLFRSYREYRDQPNMDYDYGCEYFYQECLEWKRKACAVGCVCLLLIGNAAVAADRMTPKYRGANLTLQQFSSNYNYYFDLLNLNSDYEDRLQSDGTNTQISDAIVTIHIHGQPENENASFVYDVQDGFVRGISYENTWKNVFAMAAIPERCLNAAIAALMAQDGMHYGDMKAFAKELGEKSAEPEGRISYGNVEIQWRVDALNCENSDGLYYAVDDAQESSVHLYFEIKIHTA